MNWKELAYKLLERKRFAFIIGEDGAVCALFNNNIMIKKFFIKSTAPEDLKELHTVLEEAPDAVIDIYLDVLDQSYLQKTLPAVDAFSVKALARRRIEKETPPDHLKIPLKIGRFASGRKDWMYMFVSAAYEPPISTWIEVLMPHPNVILGIHFLPIELQKIVDLMHKSGLPKLKDKKSLQQDLINIKDSILQLWHKLFAKNFIAKSIWEIWLFNNKSGGIRQAVYQNGNIVFSRLLNNVFDQNIEVVAGNIEQEVNNSIEYLRRLSLKSNDEVIVNIVIGSEVQSFIRQSKIYATKIYMFTPFSLSELLELPGNVSKESDQFCEPVILSALAQIKGHVATTHTKLIKGAINIYSAVRYARISIICTIPAFLCAFLLNLNAVLTLPSNIENAKKLEASLVSQLASQKQLKEEIKSKFDKDVDVDTLEKSVVTAHELGKAAFDPIDTLYKIANLNNSAVRIQRVIFSYNAPKLLYKGNLMNGDTNAQSLQQVPYGIKYQISLVILNKEKNYESLNELYNVLAANLKQKFNDCTIKLDPLPANFSLSQIPDSINISLELSRFINQQSETNNAT